MDFDAVRRQVTENVARHEEHIAEQGKQTTVHRHIAARLPQLDEYAIDLTPEAKALVGKVVTELEREGVPSQKTAYHRVHRKRDYLNWHGSNPWFLCIGEIEDVTAWPLLTGGDTMVVTSSWEIIAARPGLHPVQADSFEHKNPLTGVINSQRQTFIRYRIRGGHSADEVHLLLPADPSRRPDRVGPLGLSSTLSSWTDIEGIHKIPVNKQTLLGEALEASLIALLTAHRTQH